MFHRLTAPSYIGGLPVGYDYLNNPSGPPIIGGGLPAPVDPLKLGGPNDGVYFVAFGEDGRAGAVNRAVAAVALNTDVIDDFLHADTAVTASVDRPASSAATIVGTATNPIFIGPPATPNTQAGLEPYFHVTDQANNDIVDSVSNVQSVVTSASAGVGTFYVGTLTLSLSFVPTVPYRIWYGTRSSLAEMTKGEFVRPNIWSVQRKQAGFIQFTNDLIDSTTGVTKGGSLVGVDTTTFNASTSYGGGLGGLGIVNVQQSIQKINDRLFAGAGKVEINTAGFVDTVALTPIRGGGIGAAFAPGSVQQAIDIVDKQLVRRRAFMAVVTDGTTSVGGDHNAPNLDSLLYLGLGAGSYFLRPGSYNLSDGIVGSLAANFDFLGDARSPSLALAAGRTTDLLLTGIVSLKHLSISTVSATQKVFAFTDVHAQDVTIQPGAIKGLGTGGRFVLEDAVVSGAGVGGGSTNAAIEVTGQKHIAIRRTKITAANGTTPRVMHLTGLTDRQNASITVEDSVFIIGVDNVSALSLLSITVPVVFRNCLFEITATASGTGYAASINSCSQVRFENCYFKSGNGQIFKSIGSGVQLVDCKFESTSVVSGTDRTLSQMFLMTPSSTAISYINNCHIRIGNSSSDTAGSTNYPLVELGGDASSVVDAQMHVDGLHIVYDGATTGVHCFSTVTLHGGNSGGSNPGTSVNTYRNVTLDMGSRPVLATGTHGGRYSGATSAFIEIGGSDVRGACQVENISVKNIINPTLSHDRNMVFARRALIKNVTLEGAGGATTSYTDYLLWFEVCDVSGLYMTRSGLVRCSGPAFILANNTSRIDGGEVRVSNGTAPLDGFIKLGEHCELRNFHGVWTSATNSSIKPCIYCSDTCVTVDNCELFVEDSWATGATTGLMFFSTAAHLAKVTNNRLYWNRPGGINNMIVMHGDASWCISNILANANAGVPAAVNDGTLSSTANIAVDSGTIGVQASPT